MMDRANEIARAKQLDALAERLHAAWVKYEWLFGEPPHGTLKQLRAMVELEGVAAALRDFAKEERVRARNATVKAALWKGVAVAMVRRAKRVLCQYGGGHSIADCTCDPHQLGDAVGSMQEELDKAEIAARIREGGEPKE